MSKKVFSLISFVLVLSLAGNALAVDVTWDKGLGTTGDRLWDNVDNWDKDGPGDDKIPEAGDDVYIDELYTDDGNGPIIDGNTDAACEWVSIGWDALPAGEDAVLTMTGGTLTVGNAILLNNGLVGTARFDMSGGVVDVATEFYVGYGDIGGGHSIVNMNGGTMNFGEEIELGVFGDATFNMTAGDINAIYWFDIGGYDTVGSTPGNGHLNFQGGTIECLLLAMGGGGVGTMNLAGGTLIIDGDYRGPNGWLFDPLNDTPSGNGDYTGTIAILAQRGLITAYDTNVGEIITDGNYPAKVGLRAVINLDYDVTNAGQTTITAGAVDPDLAWDPDPLNGSGGLLPPDINLLSWAAGDNAASHDIYFGTSFADVDNATTSSTGIYIQRQALADVNYPVSVVWGMTYYWRIDEVNASGVPEWKGTVWNFVTIPAWATNPNPDDDAEDVSINMVLGWTPGPEVDTHEVYISTDFNDVNDRDAGVLAVVGPNYHYPGPLLLSTPYYWAVDEVNLSAVVPRWYGDIWSFTTDDHITLDDFDSYANDEAIKAVWKDFWFDTGSKNGAQVFVEAKPGLVRDGQSMKYTYVNNSAHKVGGKYVGSWAESLTADLGGATDWAFDGTRALVLYFYGDPCNGKDTTSLSTDQMYVEVEDSGTNAGIVEYPDMNAVTEDWWHEWDIDLQDAALSAVDVNNVAKVYIGFGGYTKTGQTAPGAGMTYGYPDTVYFEDIEIWPPWCRSELVATDFTGDCNTDYEDVDVMGRDWLMYDYNTTAVTPDDANLLGWWQFDDGSGTKVVDSSAYDNDGNYIGVNPSWAAGHTRQTGDYAMYFDGQGEHVICETREGNTPGAYDANLMPDKFTVSCWVNLDRFDYFGAFVTNGIDDYSSDQCGFFLYNDGFDGDENFGLAIRTETAMNYVETASVYQTGRWYHVASTFDGQYVNIYVDGEPAAGPTDVGGPMRWVSAGSGNYPENFVIGAWLDVGYELYIDGAIDEVRYYDYALPQGEISILAELVAPGTEFYQPVPSLANITDPEDKFLRKVNFRDFAILADHWLEGPTLWPQ
jgi:hypothetical protein